MFPTRQEPAIALDLQLRSSQAPFRVHPTLSNARGAKWRRLSQHRKANGLVLQTNADQGLIGRDRGRRVRLSPAKAAIVMPIDPASVLPLTSHWFVEQGYALKSLQTSFVPQLPRYLVFSARPLLHSSEITKDWVGRRINDIPSPEASKISGITKWQYY